MRCDLLRQQPDRLATCRVQRFDDEVLDANIGVCLEEGDRLGWAGATTKFRQGRE